MRGAFVTRTQLRSGIRARACSPKAAMTDLLVRDQAVMSVVPGASAELYCSVYLSTNQVSSAAMEEHAARMDKDALERLSVLTILHATCQTALEGLRGAATLTERSPLT